MLKFILDPEGSYRARVTPSVSVLIYRCTLDVDWKISLYWNSLQIQVLVGRYGTEEEAAVAAQTEVPAYLQRLVDQTREALRVTLEDPEGLPKTALERILGELF